MKVFRSSAILILLCISCVQDADRNRRERVRGVLRTLLFLSPARFSTPKYLAFDSRGDLYVSDFSNDKIRRITADGYVFTAVAWLYAAVPYGLAFDRRDNLYVADGSGFIRKIVPDGSEIILAGDFLESGFQDGPGVAARFNDPTGISIDSSGNLYVADYGNNAIRRVAPDGYVETIAGNGEPGYAEGVAAASQFANPVDVAVGPDGMVYAADNDNNRIRRIDPVTLESSTYAGTGEVGFLDGFRTEALLRPSPLTFDSAGNLYFVDGLDYLRKITPEGMVSTIAGNGQDGHRDGPGHQAMFFFPAGLTTDSEGNVYLADSYNHVIRKITPDGMVSTIAGVPGQPGGNDGPTGR